MSFYFPPIKGDEGIIDLAGTITSLWWWTWHRKVSRERLGSPFLVTCSVLLWLRGTVWTASVQPIQGWSLIVMDANLGREVAYDCPASLRGSLAQSEDIGHLSGHLCLVLQDLLGQPRDNASFPWVVFPESLLVV